MKTFFFSFFVVLSSLSYAQQKPNFLWLVCEDQSLFFTPYGDTNANTPNIKQLAEDSVVIDN